MILTSSGMNMCPIGVKLGRVSCIRILFLRKHRYPPCHWDERLSESLTAVLPATKMLKAPAGAPTYAATSSAESAQGTVCDLSIPHLAKF